ncbi:unnamed protein product [Phytomonas sp. Hart1]|nr:unnamed protein product [Phytomonas sp. Hart1]|eukprot:CCW68741.1 unnamed protein product [Phytomonas sp. isolate Hart1]
MSFLRVFGDMLHLAAIVILLLKMLRQRSSAGISLKSMILFALVFITRYLDLFLRMYSLYNTIMKVFFIATSCHICFLMKFRSPWKATYDSENDTFRIRYLIVPCLILALLIHPGPTRGTWIVEVLWAFSQYLEAVAILPQIFLLEYTERYEALTSHYLFCLGAYRIFYLLHWIVRYIVYNRVNMISVVSGIVQSLMYLDFFYHYITQVARHAKQRYDLAH